MPSTKERYFRIIDEVANISSRSGRKDDKITVIAVSKGHSRDQINEVIDAGCHDFGENRIQEALEKFPLHNDNQNTLNLHMIGSLQTNKLKKIIENCSLIHSVDSLKMAQKISEHGADLGKTANILLQVNISGELSKHGFSPDELKSSFESLLELQNISIQGLMTMAPLTNDAFIIRSCFSGLRILKKELSQAFSVDLPHLSMGMSNDYPIAIEEGATLLRVGTAIFGPLDVFNGRHGQS